MLGWMVRVQVEGGGGGGGGGRTWSCFHRDAVSVGALSGVAMDVAGREAAVVAAQPRGRESSAGERMRVRERLLACVVGAPRDRERAVRLVGAWL
jgi:hypothetical protein